MGKEFCRDFVRSFGADIPSATEQQGAIASCEAKTWHLGAWAPKLGVEGVEGKSCFRMQ